MYNEHATSSVRIRSSLQPDRYCYYGPTLHSLWVVLTQQLLTVVCLLRIMDTPTEEMYHGKC